MAKITWAGQACFEIIFSGEKDRQTTMVIDPFESKIGLKVPNFSADILLVTHNHYDHNNIGAVKSEPFIINAPGEYEIKGIFIQGIPSFHDNVQGRERGKNIIYVIEEGEVRICHLGDLGQKQLTDEQLEKIGRVDVLMIPVGGNYTIDGSEAAKITNQLEPKIVIPMHYSLPKLAIKLDGVEKFLKSMGEKFPEPQDKLIIKPSSLPKEGMMEIVLLSI